jgi:putative ABC transport system ATP-binding protein
VTLAARDISLLLGDGEAQATILDHVNIDVAAGEMVAIMGPSGAGKSSLLAICGGLRRASSGSITVGGVHLGELRDSELARIRRQRIGFVFQQSNLVPSLTALDQLLLVSHLNGEGTHGKARTEALRLLAEVGMESRAARKPAQLSGGERQRVGIARALMGNPALLLVDEPTSMLDQGRGREIVELLAQQCRAHKVATVMVTHDASMVSVVDRVVHLVDGRVVSEGAPT